VSLLWRGEGREFYEGALPFKPTDGHFLFRCVEERRSLSNMIIPPLLGKERGKQGVRLIVTSSIGLRKIKGCDIVVNI